MSPSILNLFLFGDKDLELASAFITGWPGIAVPLGSAHHTPLKAMDIKLKEKIYIRFQFILAMDIQVKKNNAYQASILQLTFEEEKKGNFFLMWFYILSLGVANPSGPVSIGRNFMPGVIPGGVIAKAQRMKNPTQSR